jgi:GTP-binding protein
VLEHVEAPVVEEGPFRMLATTIEANPYLGRILTGRITSGSVIPNQTVHVLSQDGKNIEQGRITQILSFDGLDRVPVEQANAGDIVAIAGLTKATVADTIVAPGVSEPIKAQPIDPPTLSMTFRVNNGPLAGREGSKVQSRVIRDRLLKEAEGNVALKISEGNSQDSYEVAGRGELQLAILIETMRREGFEMTIGRPRVLMQEDENGQRIEPIEEAVIDVDDDFSGPVVQKLSERRANLVEMKPSGGGRTRLIFHAPTRGLIGYLTELLTDTRGTAIFNRTFLEYQPYRGDIPVRHTGALISNGDGEAVPFALFGLEDRGPMIISPGDKVYRGMIIGEHARGNDLEVNVLKGKQLTNIRSSGKDEAVKLTTPLQMTLEKALSYITDDELVEVTPKTIRLRKRVLDPIERKRIMRSKQAESA